MKINKIAEPHYPNSIRDMIQMAFVDTRFTLEVIAKGNCVTISNVRCRSTKPYCGNHPKACERPHHGAHSRRNFLEGADWVEFNDRLNDVLDLHGVSANVASSVCILRKGHERRTAYHADESFPNGTWKWNKDDPAFYRLLIHTDCGPSDFPEGTPGIYQHKGMQYHCVG